MKTQSCLHIFLLTGLMLGTLACSKKDFSKVTELQSKPNPETPVVRVATTGCFVQSETTDGSTTKPWSIESCECLQSIETKPGHSQKSHHFKLENNLNCSNLDGGFIAISFLTGVLDGNGHNIDNLSMKAGSPALVDRLFQAGQIKNLRLTNFKNLNAPVSGAILTSLVLVASEQSIIENVIVTNAKIKGDDVAGLVGHLDGQLKNSKFQGELEGRFAGGLVFTTGKNSSIQNLDFDGDIQFTILAGGAVYVHSGDADNIQTKVKLNYIGTGIPGERLGQIGAGGLAAYNATSSASGTHYGKIQNSKVLPGSKISADVSAVFHAYFGGIVAQQHGELENIDSHMDMEILSTAVRQPYILAGGITANCHSATARSHQIRAAGTVTASGIAWNTALANISRKGPKNAIKTGDVDCHENQVQSTFQ
jgi:hypothetical protein